MARTRHVLWPWSCVDSRFVSQRPRRPCSANSALRFLGTSPRNSAGSNRVSIFMQLKDAVLYLLLVFVPCGAAGQESNPTSALAESAPSAPNFSNDQIRELIRQVAEKDLENDKKQ